MDHLLVNVPATATQKQARRVVTQIPGELSRGAQLLILTVFLEHLRGPELATALPAAILVQILPLPNHQRVRCNQYWTG